MMLRHRTRWGVRFTLAGCYALVCGSTLVSSADDAVVELQPGFSVTGHIHEAMDVSTLSRGAGGLGILASDEGAVVQVLRFFDQPGRAEIIRDVVLSQPADRELDIEASTYADGWFYVAGSHGVAKKKGVYEPARSRVYRFRLDPETGALKDLQSVSLAPIFERDALLARYHRKPLQQAGLNIEGLAARGGDLYVGLRSPNVGGDALVVRIPADPLFGRLEPPPHTLLRVPVGAGLGIRAMTTLESGFLLVLGNAGSEPSKQFPVAVDYEDGRPFELFFWDPEEEVSRSLDALPESSDSRSQRGKAEGVLVLGNASSSQLECVIVYDSIEGGGFRRFRVDLE